MKRNILPIISLILVLPSTIAFWLTPKVQNLVWALALEGAALLAGLIVSAIGIKKTQGPARIISVVCTAVSGFQFGVAVIYIILVAMLVIAYSPAASGI